MGKSLTFSKIEAGQTTLWRLEIQYKSTDKIHPSRLTNSDGRTPIIFEKESSNLQEIHDTARRMSSIYSTDEWKYVIAIINSNTSIVN
jgi:hypothetical protein